MENKSTMLLNFVIIGKYMNKFLYFIGIILIMSIVVGQFAYRNYEVIENVKSGKQQCVISSNGKVDVVWKEKCN